MELSIDILQNYLIVRLKGELDHHTSEDIRKKIDQQYYNNNLLHIILDLRDLSFMDSSGIGLIMGRYKNCKERNGKVLIISTNSNIGRILKMSGLLKIINMYSSVDEAIKD
ncbi:anti-sigma F factor antagonist [Schnuerera sp.]|uniref:anti-sigma F factor antagonist n=1 Tax=Schnuerera sp. TaxID=2794844 RepID=UPI002B8AD9B1|nr:anti-sigma F factor antagonist [Schnuerera sp.]HSH36434.1 anti-sigma F factor antagonist [Schnuerera sp.]